MKITQKYLQDLIKEEANKLLREQPGADYVPEPRTCADRTVGYGGEERTRITDEDELVEARSNIVKTVETLIRRMRELDDSMPEEVIDNQQYDEIMEAMDTDLEKIRTLALNICPENRGMHDWSRATHQKKLDKFRAQAEEDTPHGRYLKKMLQGGTPMKPRKFDQYPLKPEFHFDRR